MMQLLNINEKSSDIDFEFNEKRAEHIKYASESI